MALQDLTPQLRTRLSRMERAVGWFVIIATALLIFGFGYYIYNMAQRKGWFTTKFKYQTGVNNAAGLKEGNNVMLMGKPVGHITKIDPNAPDEYYGMTVYFTVLKPYYGYIWDDSKVKITSDFLGNRVLEIISRHGSDQSFEIHLAGECAAGRTHAGQSETVLHESDRGLLDLAGGSAGVERSIGTRCRSGRRSVAEYFESHQSDFHRAFQFSGFDGAPQ
jgi:hypothetical protein